MQGRLQGVAARNGVFPLNAEYAIVGKSMVMRRTGLTRRNGANVA